MGIVKVRISVGEPWDFLSTDGQNVLFCYTDFETCSGSAPTGTYLLARSTPFQYLHYTVESICLTRRTLAESLDEFMRTGARTSVNAAWLKDGTKWSHELASLPENEYSHLWGSFLTGTATISPDDDDSSLH